MSIRSFEEDLAIAIEYHGHLCAGQILGTRVSRLALKYFGIEEPETYKELIAFIEADRCIADAVSSVTRNNIGRRRLKFHDYGKMAATFYDMTSKKAIRIVSVGTLRPAQGEDQIAFFNQLSDSELFSLYEVEVKLDEYDLPGRPLKSVICASCGEKVMDNRDVLVDGETLCKVCAGQPSYYQIIKQLPID